MLRIPGPGKSLRRQSVITPPWMTPGNQKRTGNLFYTPPKVYNVLKDFKAKGDYIAVSDGAMGSGSSTLTSASNPFQSTDVGKPIQVQSAGAAGVNLLTTIASFNSAGSVVLTDANASGGSISSKWVEFGSDDTTLFQAAINAAVAAGGGSVYAPARLNSGYFISQLNLANISAVEFIGDGPLATRLFARQISAYTGATGHVFDLTGSLFVKLRRFQLGAFYALAKPKTGIFLAQAVGDASNRVEFDEIYLSGKYAVSTLYDFGVPSSLVRASDFYNYTTGAGTHNCLTMTNSNSASLSSAYATLTSNPTSTSNWLYDEAEFHKFADAGANNDVIQLDGVSNILFQSGVISGGATQYVTFKNASSYVTFDNVTMETESQTVTPTNAYNLAASSTLDGFATPNTSYILGGALLAGSGAIRTVKNGQQYQANSAGALTAGATYYVGTGVNDTVAASNAASLITEKGILTNMKAFTSASPGVGKNFAITVQVNGADTGITVTFNGATNSGGDNAHYALVAAGDYINFKLVSDAAANTTRFAGAVTILPMG